MSVAVVDDIDGAMDTSAGTARGTPRRSSRRTARPPAGSRRRSTPRSSWSTRARASRTVASSASGQRSASRRRSCTPEDRWRCPSSRRPSGSSRGRATSAERFGGPTASAWHDPAMEGTEVRKLAELEDAHWWYRERRHLLAKAISGLTPGRAIDIGAAGGGNTRVLRARLGRRRARVRRRGRRGRHERGGWPRCAGTRPAFPSRTPRSTSSSPSTCSSTSMTTMRRCVRSSACSSREAPTSWPCRPTPGSGRATTRRSTTFGATPGRAWSTCSFAAASTWTTSSRGTSCSARRRDAAPLEHGSPRAPPPRGQPRSAHHHPAERYLPVKGLPGVRALLVRAQPRPDAARRATRRSPARP